MEKYKKYLDRLELYKSFGYDIEWERRFIVEKAYPIIEPILEVGTGKGYLTLVLAKDGFSFNSVDIDKEEQEIAKLNLQYLGLDNKVNFGVENGENLSFSDMSFGTIFSVNMLHHLVNPFKVLDEFIRVLSSQGQIVISDFSQEGFSIIDKIHMSEGKRHKRDKTGFIEAEAYLRGKGFSIEKHRSDYQEVFIASRRGLQD